MASNWTRRLFSFGASPDPRDWGSGPGLGGWGAEGAPGASAQPWPRGPKGYKRSDASILEDVSERLLQRPDLDCSDVELKVEQGEVFLTGTVPYREMKRGIEEVADEVPGVFDITNQLRVRHGSDQ